MAGCLLDNRNYWIVGLPPQAADVNKSSFGVLCTGIEAGRRRLLPRTNIGPTSPSGSRQSREVQGGADPKISRTMEKIGVSGEMKEIRTARLDKHPGYLWACSNRRVPYTIPRAPWTATRE